MIRAEGFQWSCFLRFGRNYEAGYNWNFRFRRGRVLRHKPDLRKLLGKRGV